MMFLFFSFCTTRDFVTEVSVVCIAEFSVRDSSTVEAGVGQERW